MIGTIVMKELKIAALKITEVLRKFLLSEAFARMYSVKNVLKNFAKFTGKHLCQSDSGTGVFLRTLQNFNKHLFYRTPPVAASVLW